MSHDPWQKSQRQLLNDAEPSYVTNFTGAEKLQAPSRDLDRARQAFMSSVYGWMFLGLAITGLVGFYVSANEAALLFTAQHMLGFILGELALVVVLSLLLPKMSASVAGATFILYSAVSGVTFAPIFFAYQLGSILHIFLLTAAMFGALSIYGAVTRRDLSAWRSFLFMGLIGVLAASILGLIFESTRLQFITACASVLVFSGLTAYDNQKLRKLHQSSADPAALRKLSIFGALTLYLDFINLFLSLLRLFGKKR